MPAQSSNRNFSRTVTSNQPGIHEQLDKVVKRHMANPFLRPYPEHAITSFRSVADQVEQHQGPLIFDSFCGVGESTRYIAQQHPQALVIGIDKSLARLDKHPAGDEHTPHNNYLLLRADTDDFWRLAIDAGWRLHKHFLLYPNPWPKSSQLKRRIHGSPLFPSLLALGGQLELRSNWPTYVQEFAQALSITGHKANACHFEPELAITPFERKYQQSGQPLWQCICALD